MKGIGKLKSQSPARHFETTSIMFAVNKGLQRTRGTARAASVNAVALALEAER